jgi:two-component system CheB/CheR fusion protein
LLDISRLESGAIEPVLSDVPLGDIFEELRSEFESLARTREIRLHFDATPLAISTDHTLFYQLLQNLVGNALKYTDHGSVDISCRRDGGAITIMVEDTGIGIPADKLERIFDEYYQVDTHGTKRVGVGLGLAIVKEVARLLGVSVRIDSRVGAGTQARVDIPARFVVAATARGNAAAPQPATFAARKPRVILVEDNDGVRLATQTFLRIEGYETLSAPSVAEAERLFLVMGPGDVLVADYHLDGRNTGLDMLMKLRGRTGQEVPAIILSGDLPTVLRSIKAPVPRCRFLGKPVDTAALVEAIRELSVLELEQSK